MSEINIDLSNIDIGIVLDRIRKNAKYRRYKTYDELKNTWEDKGQILPTEKEIYDEWQIYQNEKIQLEEYENLKISQIEALKNKDNLDVVTIGDLKLLGIL